MTRSRFLPEPDLAALAPYTIEQAETRAMLVALYDRGLPLWLFPRGGSDDDYVVTELLTIDPADGAALELEIGPDRRWERMLTRDELVLVGFVDQVKIQLAARAERVVVVDGERRWRVVRDGPMYRVQRRDGFRVRPAADDPARCYLRRADGTRVSHTVLDVSVVGVGLVFPDPVERPALGRRYRDAHLQLPGALVLPCSLVVRQVADLPDQAGVYRVGCSFDQLPIEIERLLQRAIMNLELHLAGRTPSPATRG